MADKFEDAIYASPIGSTTPWRCAECNTAIAHSGDPCLCTKRIEEAAKEAVAVEDAAIFADLEAALGKKG